jgi:TolB-like protein
MAAVAIAITLLASRGTRATEVPRPAGHDPRRIAVLYFDDHSRGGELGYLANGLTEMLIHQLSQVEALEVVSRNGVKPYREAAVPFDSLVADLRVGSVVEGSVQRSGGEVRVTVQLVDAATNAHLESRTIVHPMGDAFALEDALADSVSSFLRRRLGREVKLRRIREETRSAEAWRWVMEAEEARDAAARFLRAGAPQDAASARRALARADSLLAAAERADPAWVRPTVLRGWVAHRAAPLAPSPDALEDAALAFAERALARAPADAPALELRGTLLLEGALSSANGAEQAASLDRAEADLRAALAADSSLARVWGALSRLLRYRGRTLESDAAALRALAEDAYLEGADLLLQRLFFSALQMADYARADSLCRQGGERFPSDWKFVQCPLLLLRADASRPPDATRAVRLLAELDRLDPPGRARSEGRAYAPVFRRAVAAAVVARSGATDSARAMLARARREVGRDADMSTSLAYDAAYVHRVLGEPDSARALLEWAFRRRPEMREFAARDPLFRGLWASAP